MGDGGRAGGLGTTCERVNSGRITAVVNERRELMRSMKRCVGGLKMVKHLGVKCRGEC